MPEPAGLFRLPIFSLKEADMSRPDPKKAVHVKPGQRTLGRKRATESCLEGKQGGKSQWEEHRGEYALDPWGTAIRDMRRAGTWPEEGN